MQTAVDGVQANVSASRAWGVVRLEDRSFTLDQYPLRLLFNISFVKPVSCAPEVPAGDLNSWAMRSAATILYLPKSQDRK
jgi:hypothetical protein